MRTASSCNALVSCRRDDHSYASQYVGRSNPWALDPACSMPRNDAEGIIKYQPFFLFGFPKTRSYSNRTGGDLSAGEARALCGIRLSKSPSFKHRLSSRAGFEIFLDFVELWPLVTDK